MKRFLCVFSTLVILLSCIFLNVFAYDFDGRVDGENVGKILNWQYYVTDSTKLNESSYVTSIYMPNTWVVNKTDGIVLGNFFYTEADPYTSTITDRGYIYEFYNSFYWSLEDIRAGNGHALFLHDVYIASSLLIDKVSFYIYFYDQNMQFVNSSMTTSVLVDNYNYSTPSVDIIDLETFKVASNAGAKYMRVMIELSYNGNDYLGRELSVSIDHSPYVYQMPYEFSFARYPVDGLDSSINSYYSPEDFIVNGEQNIFNIWSGYLPSFLDSINFVKTQWQFLNAGFVFWSALFSQFLGISFVKLFIYSAFVLGAIAFIIPLSSSVVNAIKSRKGEKDK